jgi:thiamine pyrophosphokinase
MLKFGLENADHTIPITVRESRKLDVILDDHSKVFYYLKFEKWYTANTISLIPIGHVTGIHSENLFYALQDES